MICLSTDNDHHQQMFVWPKRIKRKETNTMKTIKITAIIIASTLILSCPSRADSPLAISAKCGTLGLGGEAHLQITPSINARLGANAFSIDLDGTESDIEYDFGLDLLSYSALLDWHVFDGSFRITAGLILNDSDVDLTAKSATSLTIGDETYTIDEITTLSGQMTFNDIAPYIGIGWGSAFDNERRWGIITDFGVAFIGSPKVALSATGPLSNNEAFLTELERERAQFEEDVKDYKFYPVLSLSLFYRF
jgi:hypothetical protein